VNAAELEPWYKEVLQAGNPNSLSYFTFADKDCGIDGALLDELLEGVLIRSRVKPIRGFDDLIYLSVDVSCTSSVNAFSVSIRFGRYQPKPSILYDVSYGGVGGGTSLDPTYMLNGIKVGIEDAITDYISANFNL